MTKIGGNTPQDTVLRTRNSVKFADKSQKSDVNLRTEEWNGDEFDESEFDIGPVEKTSDGADAALVAVIHNIQNATHKISGSAAGAFQNRKIQAFAAARDKCLEVRQLIQRDIEEAKAHLRRLKSEELTFENQLKDLRALWPANDSSISALQATYPQLLHDVFPRRANLLNLASEMVEERPSQLDNGLKWVLKYADTHLERGRENEKAATDAQGLIRHYKALLLL